MGRRRKFWRDTYEYKRIIEILDDYWISEEFEDEVRISMYFKNRGGEEQHKCITWRRLGTRNESLEKITSKEVAFELRKESDAIHDFFPRKACALEYGAKAVEKCELYRWHDLRKDPNDLPKPQDASVTYQCVLENHVFDPQYPCFNYDDECTHSFGFYNSAYVVSNGGDEFSTLEDLGYENVIAWREHEIFDEENE